MRQIRCAPVCLKPWPSCRTDRLVSSYSEDRNTNARTGYQIADGRRLACSWDYGDIHYVQLHNYPTCAVKLESWAEALYPVARKKSFDWLENDLVAARIRGK